MKYPWIFLCFLSFLSPALAVEAPPVYVQPEFRETPIWYWQSPEKKCVPVPSVDMVSRIAPRRVRQEHWKGDQNRCEIRVDARQILAELQCNGKVLERYYAKEHMCLEHLGTREASRF